MAAHPQPESTAPSTAQRLAASQPHLHGWAADVEVDWALNREALDFVEGRVTPGDRTLETGAGYSTIVFAARGATHTVVSPFSFEHDRIRAWCTEHDVDLGGVTFIAAPSQDVLPSLEPTPLDLVLIDGDHAFPIPYVDFWYAAPRLRAGGILIVDDIHLRACHVLAEFLEADTPRWRVHTKLRTTTAFERLDAPLLPEIGWAGQPWGARPMFTVDRVDVVSRVRARVRLRSRLRAVGRRERDAHDS